MVILRCRLTAWVLFSACCLFGQVSASPPTTIGAYVHIRSCFDDQAAVAQREHSIHAILDRMQQSGINTVVPFVSGTDGVANYPSRWMPRRYDAWDPIRVFVDGARKRGLRVQLAVVTLNSGHDQPRGILAQHPEWALRDQEGDKATGGISPGHPEARRWLVAWLSELVDRYAPDGLLLDYFRFPSQPTTFDRVTSQRFDRWRQQVENDADHADSQRQRFRELQLDELIQAISQQLHQRQPPVQLGIYTWGHHVTHDHRLAQNWARWAGRGHIDWINVCGYWYPNSYPPAWGNNHREAFATVLTNCRQLLDQHASTAQLTFALGVRTSHGQVKTVVDIANYLDIAARHQLDGVVFFTWEYLDPYVPQLRRTRLIDDYAAGRAIQDLTVANIQAGQARRDQPPTATAANGQTAPHAVLRVATLNSSPRSKATADFVGDGQGDQQQINDALQALPAVGGVVELMEGTYDIRKVPDELGGVLIRRSNVTLRGQGAATRLVLAADQNTNVIRIIGSGVHHVTVCQLSVDANRAENNAGRGDPKISHDRFEYCGIKAYCRDPRGPGAEALHDITVRDCEVREAHRLGIMLEGSNLRVLDNVLGNAGSDAVELLTGPGIIRGNLVEITGQTHVAIGSDRGNAIIMANNIVRVQRGGRLDIAFRTWAGSRQHVISNNIVTVQPGGSCALAMDLRGESQTVSGNTIHAPDAEHPTRIRFIPGKAEFSGNTLTNVEFE